MTRLNITIPDEIAEKIAGISNKSRYIAEALNEKIEREKRKDIEKLLIEGYSSESKEDSKLRQDWDNTVIDDSHEVSNIVHV